MTCPNCEQTSRRIAAIAGHFRQIEWQARANLAGGNLPRGTWVHWKQRAFMAGYAAGLLEKLTAGDC